MNDIFQASTYRAAIPCFRAAAVQHLHTGDFDPISFCILFGVDDFSFIPCFLLRFYALRWSEVADFSIDKMAYHERIQIFQPKTSSTKISDNGDLPDFITKFSVPSETPICIVSYDAVRRQISRAAHIMHLSFPRDVEDSTHIFRHLTASWMAFQDSPRWRISEALGHNDPDSCSAYIHDYPALLASLGRQGG